MSKDYRFNKKEYGFDDEPAEYADNSHRNIGDKKRLAKQKAKTNFKRMARQG